MFEILGIYAGLRLFKEAKDRDSLVKVGRLSICQLLVTKDIYVVKHIPFVSSGTIILL